MSSPKSRAGLALILAAGVLGVLALLALAFIMVAQLERRAARQRTARSQALLLARSGLEDAWGRLSAGQTASHPQTLFAGEDWDRSGTLNGSEPAAEIFRPGVLNTLNCPVRASLRPSFHVYGKPGIVDVNGHRVPALLPVDTRDRGYSGGFRDRREFVYGLKVEDESGKIQVNGGFLDALSRDGDALPDHRDPWVRPPPVVPENTGIGWNDQLVRVLNVLGTQAEIGIPNLGTQIMNVRPRGGYASIQQMQAMLSITTDLSPYLTVDSWSDPTVVRPTAWSAQGPAISIAEVKSARFPLTLEPGGRPPVNLNAAPLPVLRSLLYGLAARSWYNELNPAPFAINTARAATIANALLAFREGRDSGGTFASAGLPPDHFRSWSQFSVFCDALFPTLVSGLNTAPHSGGNLCGADLLKANFDPNTRLNKELPDAALWRWIDKSDLNTWSTEGSLGPTGAFRVSAIGRVTDAGGRLLAEVILAQRLELFRFLRQTTQQDFVAGRTLSDSPRYLSLASAPWGGESLGAGASAAWWGGPPPGSGLAAVTYPNLPLALPNKAAPIDGRVGLATIELPESTPPEALSLRWVHHFDDAWDADAVIAGALPNLVVLDTSGLQTDLTESVWPSDPDTKIPTLYPDGCHVQCEKAPAYRVDEVFPHSNPPISNHGVISFWQKELQTVAWVQFSFSCLNGTPAASEFLLIGNAGVEFGLFAENTPSLYRQRVCARWFGTPGQALAPGAAWRLITAYFDTDVTSGPLDVQIDVRGLQPQSSTDHSLYGIPFNPSIGQNLFPDGNVFVLGGQANNKTEPDLQANLILDEVAILDFGDPTDPAFSNHQAWANGRYQDGRYYKLNDAAFLSAPLSPGTGLPVRLLGASWTEIRPSQPRKEIPLTSAAPPPSGISASKDTSLFASHLTVDLMDAAGGAVIRPLSNGARLDLALPSFRYRVTFRPTSGWTDAQRDSQPVLESPWFDDITFAYQTVEGPRLLGWDS